MDLLTWIKYRSLQTSIGILTRICCQFVPTVKISDKIVLLFEHFLCFNRIYILRNTWRIDFYRKSNVAIPSPCSCWILGWFQKSAALFDHAMTKSSRRISPMGEFYIRDVPPPSSHQYTLSLMFYPLVRNDSLFSSFFIQKPSGICRLIIKIKFQYRSMYFTLH